MAENARHVHPIVGPGPVSDLKNDFASSGRRHSDTTCTLDTGDTPDPVLDAWEWVCEAAARLPLDRSEQFVRTLEQIVKIITIQRPDLVRSTNRTSRIQNHEMLRSEPVSHGIDPIGRTVTTRYSIRRLIGICLALLSGCGGETVSGPNDTNAFFNLHYSDCQLSTTPEDLATPDPDRFEARTFTGSRQSMPYRLFIPDGYESATPYSLVLYLHGGAGRGTDNLVQITTNANLVATHLFSSPAVQRDHPCFVLAPQIQEVDGLWASFDPSAISDNLFSALEIVDAVESEFNIDRRRVYAVGNSLGGGGAWDILTKESSRFAAVMPMASDVRWGGIAMPQHLVPTLIESIARSLKGKHFWFFYGGNDGNGALKPWWEQVVRLLRAEGEDPKFTEYVGGEHPISRCVFTEPDLVPWLFSHTLSR